MRSECVSNIDVRLGILENDAINSALENMLPLCVACEVKNSVSSEVVSFAPFLYATMSLRVSRGMALWWLRARCSLTGTFTNTPGPPLMVRLTTRLTTY